MQGPFDADQQGALVRGRSPFPKNAIRRRRACQTHSFASGSNAGSDRVRLACSYLDRARSGAGPRAFDQAGNQTGRPHAVEPGNRCRRSAAPLGTVCGGQRPSITVAMDWTEFEADGQATIMLSLLCSHGRATPLVWLTVDTATLKNRRNGYEYQVLVRLAEVLPAGVHVCIVADRGFGDHKLYRVLTDELKFDFVIRFRGNIRVTAADGELADGNRVGRQERPGARDAKCHS